MSRPLATGLLRAKPLTNPRTRRRPVANKLPEDHHHVQHFTRRLRGRCRHRLCPHRRCRPLRAKLPHTNQFQLGTLDKKGCFCPCKQPDGKSDAKWTVNNPGNGKADIDLGNYKLQLDEKNSQIKIVNKNNGEVTNIWGDPHIDWNKDGKTDANFWGTTTFQLEDGTKITIDTEPFKNNPNECVSSEVTVTRGDHALKITGLSQNKLGDLQVEYADRGGQALDWATQDGFVVRENPNGEGWLNADTGKLAGQKDFDITKPNAVKPYEFTQQFGQALGLFLMTGLMGGIFSHMGSQASSWEPGRSSSDTLRCATSRCWCRRAPGSNSPTPTPSTSTTATAPWTRAAAARWPGAPTTPACCPSTRSRA
ncbi:DUF1521 domain-containing protein [Ottowia beijingensis]|uniref:DUF1521 domain-containing protein n=1 Tax=Ottowia beijingensis TaxID=1207057 RepID=A0A853IUA4_9BURK|nr:DUF1521 domain-containing protein [Ottowia beijingensis]NZA01391.1 DUF1521 domain-containing protein [Ottowia beijingensis]